MNTTRKLNDISLNRILLFVKIFLAILFVGCLFDMTYGYFQLVRFLGMVGFGVLALNSYKKNKTWFAIWVSSAILINPIFKIALGREIWNVVDIIWALLLMVSIFIEKKERGETL